MLWVPNLWSCCEIAAVCMAEETGELHVRTILFQLLSVAVPLSLCLEQSLPETICLHLIDVYLFNVFHCFKYFWRL